VRDLRPGGVLIGSDDGLFVVRVIDGVADVKPAIASDAVGDVSNLHDFPGGGVLVQASEKLFLARLVKGVVTVKEAATVPSDTDWSVLEMHDVADGVLLVHYHDKLFFARAVDGVLTVNPVVPARIGSVSTMHSFLGGGVLLSTDKGLFLAHAVAGAVIVDPLGERTGDVLAVHDLSTRAAMITSMHAGSGHVAPGSPCHSPRSSGSRHWIAADHTYRRRRGNHDAIENRQEWRVGISGDCNIDRREPCGRRTSKAYVHRPADRFFMDQAMA
jgi:hypothetical protein